MIFVLNLLSLFIFDSFLVVIVAMGIRETRKPDKEMHQSNNLRFRSVGGHSLGGGGVT